MAGAATRPAIPAGITTGRVVAIGRHVSARADVILGSPDELAVVTQRAAAHDPAELARAAIVIDPIGAGDAFCAGFIAARLDGADLATALEMGNACGAAAASAMGDQTGLPDRAELAAILRSPADAGAPDTIR